MMTIELSCVLQMFVLQRVVGVKECKNDILNGCLMVYTSRT
jgi:hypothetical protein